MTGWSKSSASPLMGRSPKWLSTKVETKLFADFLKPWVTRLSASSGSSSVRSNWASYPSGVGAIWIALNWEICKPVYWEIVTSIYVYLQLLTKLFIGLRIFKNKPFVDFNTLHLDHKYRFIDNTGTRDLWPKISTFPVLQELPVSHFVGKTIYQFPS